MELRHLRAFVAVAETLHFRRAARRLGMTQPPLSATIKALEEEIGVVLLDRKRKKDVRLTSAGESFLLAAERLLQDVERAKETARLTDQGDFGSLSVGYNDDFVYGSLPDLLNRFSRVQPNTWVRAYQEVSYRLVKRLGRNEVDCIFTTQPLHKAFADCRVEPWPATPIVAVLPINHPLAKASSIRLRQLAEDRFLTVAQSNRTRFDDQTRKMLVGAGISPLETLEIMSGTLAIEMVRRGHGVALASLESVPVGQGGVAVLRLEDKGATLERVIAWREENDSPSLGRFLEIAIGFEQ